jgi:RNA polymerase sigma-70 factor (ECF subfamily)
MFSNKIKAEDKFISDASLADMAAGGDRGAFEQIVGRYCGQLLEFTAGRAAVYQDAEDIVQETFLRAYTNIDLFDRRYSFKTWLFTIAYRIMISSYRKKRPKLLLDNAAEELAEKSTGTDEDYQWLWDEIKQLGTEAYTALWLKYRQELSVEEIATIMKKSKVGIRVLLHRARNRLMKKLTAEPRAYDKSSLWPRPESVCKERIG